jgi:large subunit ribosomal protein L21
MQATVAISGKQFVVKAGDKVFVPKQIDKKVGDKLSFGEVLLVSDGVTISVGTPVVKGAVVNATIVSHLKGEKVVVFKKKRRKRYRLTKGHRQDFTQVEITGITA